MFGLIDPNNSRRFVVKGSALQQVLAVFDACRSWTKYAVVGTDSQGRVAFVSEPRTYFADEMEEL